jgi:VWFA-related protein
MRARPFLFALVAAFVVPLTAQEPQQPTFRTEANYIRVDVYPTSNGVPVTDLRKEDFEIFDEGAPQTIDAFELVRVPGLVPQDSRREPTTVAESRALLENPRARVFVIFLDYHHVDVAGSRQIRDTLVDALDRFLGPEDLFAVMTPEMSALDLSFARKTTTVRGMLEKYWTWGERDQLMQVDPQDAHYRSCFMDEPQIAEEMIERRRELVVLDALQDVVRHLRGIREERKAILTISTGWRLFRRSENLLRPQGRQRRPPTGLPPVGVDPRTGGVTTNAGALSSADQALCERDRLALANTDHAEQFRDIIEEANRGNAAFYPLDPQGLVAFGSPIATPTAAVRPATQLAPSEDRGRVRERSDSLRILAADTDGMAIVQTNDIEAGFKRIVSDLSSYYLLGYYSDRRMDGRFHKLRVEIKRPGVQVRARRGYLAPSATAATSAANRVSANAAPSSAAALETRAIESALAPLNSLARERPLRLHGVAGWRPDATAAVWAVGEVSAAPEWRGGADVDLLLVDKDGGTIATSRVEVPAGRRDFATKLAPPAGLSPGDYTVTARARGRGVDPNPTTASLVVTVRDAAAANGNAVLIRRGPTTGNREVPTADIRFRRTDQLKLEIPAAGSNPGTGRLLDRNGKPLPLPVTAGVRNDPDGSRWHTAHLVLAPLAAGDYVIEFAWPEGAGTAAAAGTDRILIGFRVVP